MQKDSSRLLQVYLPLTDLALLTEPLILFIQFLQLHLRIRVRHLPPLRHLMRLDLPVLRALARDVPR